MGDALNFGEGLRMLLDGQQRYVRGGLQMWLRLQNFPDSGTFIEVGVPFTPTGTGDSAATTGFTDILIDPPPEVKDISMHNIGILAGRLNFGDKTVIISHTFVLNMLQQYPDVTDPFDVFRDWDGQTPVVGIIYQNRMYSIDQIFNNQLGGETISWRLIIRGREKQITEQGAQEGDLPQE